MHMAFIRVKKKRVVLGFYSRVVFHELKEISLLECYRVYPDIDVRKVERVSNGAAHVLAQLGKSGCIGFLRDAKPTCVCWK
jgi:hypothetical protein